MSLDKKMASPVASTSAQAHPIDLKSSITESKIGKISSTKISSLAALWAKNYIISVTTRDAAERLRKSADLAEITSQEGRLRTAKHLKQSLKLASAQAWSLTENLLAEEVRRHGIDLNVINPWQIAADSHALFEKALAAYGDRVTPRRLSVLVGNEFGRVRQKYTADDPRAIGFVSMQFHYTGQTLLESLSSAERLLLEPYFKVMDDHLYMPLRAAYEAAGNHSQTSPALRGVQHLLPISTRIAQEVCKQICRQSPSYETYSGSLSAPQVRTSSIRDVEMFQVYLCLCVLEDSIESVQRELFPLCAMLYPRLKVSWRLVQEMLQAIGWEMHDRLSPNDVAIFLPYLGALTEMFSNEVFQSA